MSKLRESIPIFRNFIANNTTIVLSDILNGNSLFQSDMSKLSTNGEQLLMRRRDDNPFILFDLVLDKIIRGEQNRTKVNILYEATFSINAYGTESSELIIELQSKMLSQDGISYFYKNDIGLNPDIEINSSYETINGVQWLRTIATIKFTYEKDVIVENLEIHQLGLIEYK